MTNLQPHGPGHNSAFTHKSQSRSVYNNFALCFANLLAAGWQKIRRNVRLGRQDFRAPRFTQRLAMWHLSADRFSFGFQGGGVRTACSRCVLAKWTSCTYYDRISNGQWRLSQRARSGCSHMFPSNFRSVSRGHTKGSIFTTRMTTKKSSSGLLSVSCSFLIFSTPRKVNIKSISLFSFSNLFQVR